MFGAMNEVTGDTGTGDRERTFLRQAGHDPGWHLHYLDVVQGHAGFLQLTRDDYRDSVFLDDRIRLRAPKRAQRTLVRLDSLVSQWPADEPSQPAHFIFHPGHCGTTLISRLLDQLPGVLGIREPAPLRVLAAQWREQGDPLAHLSPTACRRLERVLFSLYARTFTGDRRVVVKATSDCCNLAGRVHAFHQGSRLLWVYADLETFLSTMLRNDVRREETRQFAQPRLMDLHRWLDTDWPRLHEMGLAERTAMNWISSMAHMLPFSDDARLLAQDFGDFLAHPEECLGAIAAHFGLQCRGREIRAALDSEVMRHYSKEPTSRFDAEQRARQLDASRRDNRKAIETGLAFAESMQKRFPALEPLSGMLRAGSGGS